jgi:sensor histidine kinase YesM
MFRHIYFLTFLFGFFVLSARANDTVIIHNMAEADSIIVLNHAAYYIDKTNHLEWPVIAAHGFIFTKNSPEKNPDFKQEKTTLWVRCTIKNAAVDSIPLLLIFYRFAYFKTVIVARSYDTLIYRPNYFFSLLKKTKRKNIPLRLAKGEQLTVWVQIFNPNANLFKDNFYITNIPAYERFLKELYDEESGNYISKIVFLAIVAFITMHTLVQYFIRRRREFIFYAFYSASVFLLFLRQFEMSLHYDIIFSFFPYIHKFSNTPLSILVYYTYFRFARQFVDFALLARWFYKTIIWTERWLITMFVADILCSILGYYGLEALLFVIVRITLLVISFIGIFILLRSGKKVLYFFGIGSLMLIIGSLLAMVFTFYSEQSPVFKDNPMQFMQIGIVLELLCFTSGLSYKSNMIEVEKQNTQLQLISQLEENRRLQEELNIHLEERVNEQTEEILVQQRQLEKEKEQQLTIEFRKKLAEMELQVLKAQLNPHFYFNTLNNLYGLTIIDPKKAPDAILKLSDIMEYIIYDCKSEKVSLEKELKFISSYIELERLRYEDNADISLNIRSSSSGQLISPLLLIQFVENAFKHGMEQNKNESYMQVDITVENNYLFFRSVNNMKQQSGESHGLGLSNVQKRLLMLYPNRHQLVIDRTGSEFKVELHLELS